MADHVLVPVDDSEPADRALEYALEHHPDATLTALHVVDPAAFYEPVGFDAAPVDDYATLQEIQDREAETVLERARDTAAAAGRDVETERRIGGVSRTIVEFVEEADVDEIVMGSHGRTGASRVLLGSVAETVVRRSPVPVTIVR